MDPEKPMLLNIGAIRSCLKLKKARGFFYEESLGGTGRSREFFDPARNVKIRLEINEA
jgi:hypothetical protein